MKKSILAAFLAVASFGGISQASTIGVHFLGRDSNQNPEPSLAPTDVAGEIPQSNWNNRSGSSGSATTENYTALVDSTGAATAVTLTAAYNDSWNSGSGSATHDNNLLNGIMKANGVGATITYTYANLTPGGSYNVVLETAENGGGSNGTISSGAASTSVVEVDGATQTGPIVYNYDPTLATASNFVPLNGLTADGSGNLVITVTHNSGSDGFGVGGIQLQSVPEPASLGLLGLGSLGLIARRRRA